MYAIGISPYLVISLQLAFLLTPRVFLQLERLAVLPPAAPSTWCVAGSFQPGGGWDNGSDPLYDDGTHGDMTAGDGILSLQYTIAKSAATFEWKIFNCGTWDGYPGEGSGNKWLYTSLDNQLVTFTFNTNLLNDGFLPAYNIAMVADSGNMLTDWTVVGDWQSIPWNTSDTATVLKPIGASNPGVYLLHYNIATPGTFQYVITTSGSWNLQYDPGGRIAGSFTTGAFTTTVPNQYVTFVLDTNRPGIKAVPWHLFLPMVNR